MVCDFLPRTASRFPNLRKLQRFEEPEVVKLLRKQGLEEEEIDGMLSNVNIPTDLVGLIGLPKTETLMGNYRGVIQRLNQEGRQNRARELAQRQRDLTNLLRDNQSFLKRKLEAHRQAHLRELQSATPAERNAKIRRIFGDLNGDLSLETFSDLTTPLDDLDLIPAETGLLIPEGLGLDIPGLDLPVLELDLGTNYFELPSLDLDIEDEDLAASGYELDAGLNTEGLEGIGLAVEGEDLAASGYELDVGLNTEGLEGIGLAVEGEDLAASGCELDAGLNTEGLEGIGLAVEGEDLNYGLNSTETGLFHDDEEIIESPLEKIGGWVSRFLNHEKPQQKVEHEQSFENQELGEFSFEEEEDIPERQHHFIESEEFKFD